MLKIYLLTNNIALAMVQKEPGIIVGPISKFLGYILNIIFNIVYSVTRVNSLGIAIIFFTILVKTLLLPLAIKSAKSMANMQKLQPEMDKINKKYANVVDPELKNKKNIEIQKLYSENKVNPLGGCLPLFIQLPIFTSLFYIMNQSYLFIDKIGVTYKNLASSIMQINGYIEPIKQIQSLGYAKIPKSISLDLSVQHDLLRLLNKYKISDWNTYLNSLPQNHIENIKEILNHKLQMDQFFGISLIENAGISWPSILIPIIATITMFLSSYLSMKIQPTPKDENTANMQKTMIYVMPFITGFMTISMPSGVGLYWITSNIFQLFQQIVLNKFIYNPKEKTANTNVI